MKSTIWTGINIHFIEIQTICNACGNWHDRQCELFTVSEKKKIPNFIERNYKFKKRIDQLELA
jgi:hypothetical protein